LPREGRAQVSGVQQLVRDADGTPAEASEVVGTGDQNTVSHANNQAGTVSVLWV